jgi:SAM-dependent methyltransferase
MTEPELLQLELLQALHVDGERQGPGSDAQTLRAIELAGLSGAAGRCIADFGCGTGAAARLLARLPGAQVYALDFLPAFIDELRRRAAAAGLGDALCGIVASMEAPPFAPASLDVIWAEGAIYNLGFERGLALWRPLLRPGGVLAVSELTWLTAERPDEIDAHWRTVYPEVATAGVKIAQLEALGYDLIAYFALPRECWLDHYYTPLEARFGQFLARSDDGAMAREIVAEERREIALFRQYADYFSYGFYIARRSA